MCTICDRPLLKRESGKWPSHFLWHMQIPWEWMLKCLAVNLSESFQNRSWLEINATDENPWHSHPSSKRRKKRALVVWLMLTGRSDRIGCFVWWYHLHKLIFSCQPATPYNNEGFFFLFFFKVHPCVQAISRAYPRVSWRASNVGFFAAKQQTVSRE